MAKIKLILPPHNYEGGSRAPEGISLGLGYIGKALMNEGHDVELLDIWLNQLSKEQVIKEIKNFNCEAIGINAFSTQYSYVKWLCEKIKEHTDIPILMGGALPTFSMEIILKNTMADVCVIGEGEITMAELLKYPIEDVSGIWFKRKGKIFANPPREQIKDLDQIDFPAWELFDVEKYIQTNRMSGSDKRAMPIISGRGCPYNCRFCSKTLFRGFRFRSVSNIIKEIETVIERYDINFIDFVDDLLIISTDRAFELCDAIEPLNVKWCCQGRSNIVILEILKRMKKAGCVGIGYGVESGSQKILDLMNKQITVKQSKEAVINTINLGMDAYVQIMYGYPGETKETLEETVHFFDTIPYKRPVFLSATTPVPGSPLYNDCLKNGLIKDEVKYIESLEAGWLANTEAAKKNRINPTEFSDEDYWKFKEDAERRIFKSQVRRFPLHFLKQYIAKTIRYYQRRGIKKLIKRLYNALKLIASGRPA